MSMSICWLPIWQVYIETVDRLNFLMRDLGIDQRTRRRAREYLSNTKSAIKRGTYPDVLAKFACSSKLHAQIADGLGTASIKREGRERSEMCAGAHVQPRGVAARRGGRRVR